ncbi:amino acid adenylation domain-containing protein [Candidatus Tisiphia endosymbiont of Stenodema calcarata]|uniref:amino acid adenylation domain-containing protein n=1 Tax=Candidatus Tisiphia endosymbiont of Stenodema calcarata TaxID=3139337 RepID=UPI003CCA764E
MLEDSKTSILLTTKEIRDSLDLSKIHLNNEGKSNVASISSNPYLKNIKIICLDGESLNKSLQLEKDTNPNIQIPADSLCYIIYTSGSTGRPKGITCIHRGMVNRLFYPNSLVVAWDNTIGCVQSNSVFVDATWDIFSILTSNSKLVLYKEVVSKNIEEATNIWSLHGVERATITPSILSNLIDITKEDIQYAQGIKTKTLKIKSLKVTGEYFNVSLSKELFETNTSIINLLDCYGATEATSVIYRDFDKNNTEEYSTHILSNTQIHILDSNLNQVPIGTTGEICIGGAGLARGYVGKPGLTSEKFIANPYGNKEETGSRLYRTGDLGRYLADGNIEFIGRIDHQAKIRGFRIELGEIESILSQSNRVKQAVVLAREDIVGQKRLAGYVVLKEVSTKDEAEQELIESLRELTAKSLPDYMQLSQIVILDEFPLTQNGKLDRKVLPAPEGREGVGLYQVPEGLLEQRLAVIWQELLKIEKVGRNDNFFNLGGHSLNVLLMIARLRSEEDIEVPIDNIFQHPTLQEFARSLTDKYLSQDSLPPIERVSRDQLIPLSFAQQRLWFIDQLVTGNGLYHIPRAVRLAGELDVSALRKALNHMVRRHEILRTLIISKEGLGTQLILNEDTPFNLIELSLDTKEELDDYLTQESTSPFDFEKTPLCKGSLIKFNGEYILLIIFHHIISDGWSAGIWNRELSELYLAYKQGIEANLLPLPIQYADFSIWQRSWLTGDVLKKQLGYWQEQLADISMLELPTDYQRPKQQSYKGSSYSFQLNKEVVDSLNAISKDNGATLFMTILSAFQGTLSKYSNQTDIVIGTPIAGRRMQDTEGLIGFFVNTLVLRASTEHNPTFKELLSQVKQTTLGAYSNQDIPFEQLVEYLNAPRDLSRHPIFQVMFILQNNKQEELRFGDIKAKGIGTNNRQAKFDLTLNITETQEGLNLRFEYASDLFKQETIERLCNYYTSFIDEIIQNQDKRLSDILILDEIELTKLQTWNETKYEYTKDKTIHQLFEESVRRSPDRIAITYEDQQISYRVLNQRVNQLAHYLVKQGVGLETPIAISIPRSPEMIIGLLAILKSGGSYVPIDPEYPTERIHYMLEDSKTSILLTTKEIRDSLDLSKIHLNNEGKSNVASISSNPYLKNIKIICLDGESFNKSLQLEKDTNPNIQIPADSLCYIIYTSGSTGRPKGVRVRHEGLSNLVMAQIDIFTIKEKTRVVQFASTSFDAHVSEIFTTIIKGASLHLVSKETLIDRNLFINFVNSQKINLTTFPPNFLNSLSPQDVISIETIVAAGEALSKDLVDKWHQYKFLINAYGPTESTVCASSFLYTTQAYSPNTIGRPIHNTQIHILDSNLNQVPIGTTGEICIGGVGLARGYVGKPGLTSEKFIANPYGNKEETGSRLYRTGDLGRYLADGNIEFIGRIDHQVKIRGFRIELGEIESILSQSNRIKQAVVLAREDIACQKRLVGYVVLKEVSTKDKAEESEQELIESLRELTAKSLPDYMQLSQIVILDEFPLTQNGKLDRKALPALEGREGVGLYQAPEGLLEQRLAVIWQELLKIEKVGRNDNFFNLGGHSLVATQLIAKIRNEQKIEIPLQAIFQHPTLQEFARSLTDKYLSQDSLPPIERVSRDQLIPLSFAQQRLWFIDQLVTGNGLYHIPRAVRLAGELDVSALRKALNHMVRRHEILRTLIISKEGLGTQLILNEDTPFNLIELSLDTKEELDDYLTQESTSPFDFEKTPLCKGSLIKFNGEYILLIIFHHIISDGWSASIWNRELSELYLAYKQGIEANLLPLPIQYADFSIWQRSWLTGDVLKKQLGYWQEQLADISMLELPTDYQRPKQQSYKGSSYSFQLNKEVVDSLNAISKDNGTTLFMTILSAFQGTLSKYSNQTDIVIGTPIAGRRMQDTEGLIGFFVNTLVLRASTEHNPTFKELLSQVKQTTLGAYSNQDIPFEQLVEYLNAPRDLSRHPIFQVMFILQNNKQGELRFGDIKAKGIGTNNRQAKFDLTLNITETQEGLNLRFEYASDLFKQETIERLCNYYTSFIDEIIQNQDKRLSDILILDEIELTKLQTWNETKYEYPKDKTIHQLFEESVRRSPDRIAITYKDQQISYRVLNQRVNQLAHYLVKQGVGLETAIAISTPRSPKMIIGLLAILKSGGIYVPIDPEYPTERIHYMLEDGKTSILLTTKEIRDSLDLSKIHLNNEGKSVASISSNPYLKNIKIICLDGESLNKSLQSEIDTNPNIQIPADSLCYIIYTSGSTGKPKGVGVRHDGLSNLVRTQINIFTIKEKTRVLQFASPSFDVHVSEIFTTIIKGASLHLVSKETLIDRNLFINFVNSQKINLTTFPPSFLNNLSPQDMINIETIVVAGEALSKDLVDKWHQYKFLINAYGPTESTVYASSFLYTTQAYSPNTIGRPIHNTQIHILDSNLNQVPIGTTGEICIGGVGLARGYVGKPGLTSEKFIANPYGNKEEMGSRLYRTGDLGRYLADGNIEFIGRIDHQVKIRGFRIELGEIESILSQSNRIKQAVVLAREDIVGQKRLVGYVVLKEVSTKDEAEQELIESLRELTAKSLPDYMQLSQIVILDEFPLTQNGKLDRKALPVPRREGVGLYQAPEGLLEQKLAVIWQELLKIEKVGRNDNFFNLGGHSLVAILLISKIRRDEKIEVPLEDIFEHSTLKSFSKNLEKLSKYSKLLINSKSEGIIFKITDEIDEAYNSPLYLIHEGIGIIHPYINLKNILANPLYAIEDPYIGEEHSGFANINEMINYYAESIKRHHQKYHSYKPISIGGWSFGGIVAYEIAILLNELLQVDNLIIIDRHAQVKKDRTKNLILNKKQGNKPNINRNSKLLIDYKITQNYNSKLTLVKAKINSHMDIQSDNDLIDHYYGWGKFAKEVVVYEAEGNHYTLFHEDNIISIGKILNNLSIKMSEA